MQVDLCSSLVYECLDRHAPLIRTKVSRYWHHHWLTFWITVILNRYFHRRGKSPEAPPYRRSMRSKPTMNSALFQFCLYCLKSMNASRWNKWPSFHPMRLVVFSRTRSAPIVKDITQLYCYYRHAWWHPESHAERGKVTMLVLADFSKAFDTIAFVTILRKLHHGKVFRNHTWSEYPTTSQDENSMFK